MLEVVSFSECVPLLQKLWPEAEKVQPIDNLAGLIEYAGNEYHLIKPKYFLWFEGDIPVGTVHLYNCGAGRVRVRGSWIQPELRGRGIGAAMLREAMAHFPEAKLFFTFCREGSESFYKSLGFVIKEKMRYAATYRHGYVYAEKRL